MKRILTSLLLIPTVTWIIFGAPAWLVLAAITVFAVLCFREYSRLTAHYGFERPGILGYVAGVVLLLLPHREMLLFVLTAMLALILYLRLEDLARTLPAAAVLLLGVVYCFGAWKCAIYLHGISSHWLMFGVAINWVGDIAAYYCGRAFGRHKLAPRVSPGKSWEGAIASLVFSVALGTVYIQQFVPGVQPLAVAGIATAANIAGQFGDLAESALKRGAGVKDSGTMLPGHGGWLDRLDSSLFAMPVVYFFVAW
jgi:phosphatidate cytidylyltransferase